MAPESIFVITIDARPRLLKEQFDFDIEAMKEEEQEKLKVKTYQEWFGRYVEEKITRSTISGVHVAALFYAVVAERIRDANEAGTRPEFPSVNYVTGTARQCLRWVA